VVAPLRVKQCSLRHRRGQKGEKSVLPTRGYLVCLRQIFFYSHWNKLKVQDTELFVLELERTSLLFLVSTDKTFGMIYRCYHSCHLEGFSKRGPNKNIKMKKI
jgi:hypothetical protein